MYLKKIFDEMYILLYSAKFLCVTKLLENKDSKNKISL